VAAVEEADPQGNLPSPAMPGPGPLGLRWALLGLAAALGWLLVLQPLLDLRALGLLCGVLTALGGWLGPRALRTPGWQLRLERFVSSLRPPPHCPAAEGRLEREIAGTVRKVVRDFVTSWYRTVSSEQVFEAEVEKAMMGLAAELRRRMGRVDRQALARRLLLLCGHHLQSYLRAREALQGDSEGGRTLWREYSRLAGPHPALRSPAAEVGYARAAVEMLLQALVPRPHLETRTGRFVVVELVACNVLLPVIRKMADPDSINLLLIGAFSKKPRGEELPPAPPVPDVLPCMVQADAAPAGVPPSPRAMEVPRREAGVAGEEGEDPASGLCRAEEPFLRPRALGSLFPCEGLELESPAPNSGQDMDLLAPSPAGEFLDELLQETSTVLEEPATLEDGVGDLEEGVAASSDAGLLCTCASALSSCPDIQIDLAVEKEEGSPGVPRKSSSQRPSSLGKDLGGAEGPPQSPSDPGQTLPLLSSSPTASISTFSFEPLSSPDGPVVIQNLRITGTITAREHSGTGFHPYTLYTVKVKTGVTPFPRSLPCRGSVGWCLEGRVCAVCDSTANFVWWRRSMRHSVSPVAVWVRDRGFPPLAKGHVGLVESFMSCFHHSLHWEGFMCCVAPIPQEESIGGIAGLDFQGLWGCRVNRDSGIAGLFWGL